MSAVVNGFVNINPSKIYNDWFLPSDNELNHMWINLHSGIDENLISYTPVGNFYNTIYWTSSEYDTNNAHQVMLSYDNYNLDRTLYYGKNFGFSVRCVRNI
jgi:hypothetical protein